MDIPHRITHDGVLIEVKVTPRSSRKGVAGMVGDCLNVKLTAPPVDGEANAQLIGVLADYFSVRRSDIEVVKGASSRRKIVKLRGLQV
ncbi:MAG: YggU family protein [Nitrospiraceae bacterium]|jgi:uncharacterized protein (TIGR00251 family)|nr:YggU family protein [Nitrospiraceae bacterium]